ncbi:MULTISPECIES: hypothetical protein [Streptomyces]|uniref:hypothetical protein n=1 Tax=Streptomyces TaxID=1883 RepID=UPI0015759E57|nr:MULTISPECIES: hypothetical protein [unclassified Streptomyces]MDH6455898.1 hypothetical protein [Streptomyces sp. SAI-119]QUC63794.1 hypothetical protein IOD14_23385 [Streptomyces sp. A2-16]
MAALLLADRRQVDPDTMAAFRRKQSSFPPVHQRLFAISGVVWWIIALSIGC